MPSITIETSQQLNQLLEPTKIILSTWTSRAWPLAQASELGTQCPYVQQALRVATEQREHQLLTEQLQQIKAIVDQLLMAEVSCGRS